MSSMENDFEKAKKLFESFDFDALTGGINQTIEKLPKMIEPFQKELQKLNNPLKKKNVKINGIHCVASLIEDGRVIVQMPTLEEAQKLYDSINTIKPKESFWSKIFK